jgi:integrase
MRRGSIKQRSPGSYRLRVTGKRIVATATIRGTRNDAKRELTKLLRLVDTNEHVEPSRMTVAQWLEHWIEAVRAAEEVSPKTHERYAEIVRCHLTPALGTIQLVKLTPTHIQKAYTAWATSGRHDDKPGGLAPLTRLHIHRVLKSALSCAVEQRVLARNPADFKRRLPRIERREMTVLTVEQSNQLLDTIRHTRTYWPVLLALATGMRRGEILALRWRNVDLDQGIIRMVESLEQTKDAIRFKSPKNNKARVIALPAFAVDELRRLKLSQAEELLRVGVRQSGDTLVCCREDGEPKQPRSLTHDFTYFIRRLPLPQVSFHDLRHSHATHMLASGVHPKVASERLGHSKVGITLDLYSHVLPDMQSEAAAKIDLAFRRSS